MKTQLETIQENKEIAKRKIIQAIDELTSKHKDICFEIEIENKTMDYLNEEKTNYYIVHIGAKI